MGKSGSLSAMRHKLKMYDERKEIEKMLDLNQNTFALKKILQAQDDKLIAEEQEIKARGFCPDCHRVMTTTGACSNPMCEGINIISKGVKCMSILTEVQVNDLAICLSEQYQDDPIDQSVMYDSLVETITEWSESYGEHPVADAPEPADASDDDEFETGITYI